VQIRGDKAIVQLEEVDSEEKALSLKSSTVYLPLEVLPELPDDKYYYHEIVGFQVQDTKEGTLGTVAEIIPMPMHNILVMDFQNQEVLIPVTDEVVTKVDKVAKVVHTLLPEGLLDVYMNPEAHTEADDAD
jgi:16S rRNA processing protein RimM